MRLSPRCYWEHLITAAALLICITRTAVPATADPPENTPTTSQPAESQPALEEPLAATQPAESQPAPQEPPPALEELSLSDDTDLALLELEVPVVVTAARHAQPITNVPHAISVITAKDIRRSGARSVPDALRLVPGVDVAHLAYSNYAVSPRGFHGLLSRQVLVLMDGRGVFDSGFGAMPWGSWPFQLEDVERIEVIRGPASVSWGAGAVNGVINVITKDPRDQLGLTITADGGSRGVHKEHLGYAFADQKLRFRISGEYEASDGFLRGGSLLRKLDDEYKMGRVSIRAVYEASPDDTVTLTAMSGTLDGGWPRTPLASIHEVNSRSQAGSVFGKWVHRYSSDNSFELSVYGNDFGLCLGAPMFQFRYQQLAVQFVHTFKPAVNHTINWGVETHVDLLDGTNAHPSIYSQNYIKTGVAGIYVQDEWRFAPRWALNFGGRIAYDFYGGFDPSARIALSYKLGEASLLYAAASRAVQMPAAPMRLLHAPLADGLACITGNRGIDPGILLAYELGYRGQLFNRLSLDLNLFLHNYDNLAILRPLPGPPGLLQIRFDEGFPAYQYGVELGTKYEVTDKLTLLGNYTYEVVDARGDYFSLVDTDSVCPPKHKFMIGTRYSPTDDLHLAAHLYYVDAVKAPNPANPFVRRAIPRYFRLDLNAEYEFWNDRAAVAVGVQNLLDPHHYEGGTIMINDAEVPRMIYAQLRLKFD